MWNSEDKYGFQLETLNNRGQINLDQDFGKKIYELAKDITGGVFVDIGTWNGLGSTKCFIEAMKDNSSSKLYSIENNTEKYESAKSQWTSVVEEHKLDVDFINGTLVSNSKIDEWIEENNILLNENESYWLSIDKTNSVSLIILDCSKIDILLIDGSEFTGYLEMMLLKDKSNYILLDDVNSMKNKYSREYLISDNDFELIEEDLSSRNGYSIFKRISS